MLLSFVSAYCCRRLSLLSSHRTPSPPRRRPQKSPTTSTCGRSFASTASRATAPISRKAAWRSTTIKRRWPAAPAARSCIAGDLASSRLWALVSHTEEPKMPPRQDKLAAAKLDADQQVDRAGRARKLRLEGRREEESAGCGRRRRDRQAGRPVAMPEDLLKQPVVYHEPAGQITALATSPWAPLVAIAGQKQVALYQHRQRRAAGHPALPGGHSVRRSASAATAACCWPPAAAAGTRAAWCCST